MIIGTLVARIITNIFRSVELKNTMNRPFFCSLWHGFWGWYSYSWFTRGQSDYWIAAVLGMFELGAFPVLKKLNAWNAIGAWIGFKALAQWSAWRDNRNTFNRFLVENSIILIFLSVFLVNILTIGDRQCYGKEKFGSLVYYMDNEKIVDINKVVPNLVASVWVKLCALFQNPNPNRKSRF